MMSYRDRPLREADCKHSQYSMYHGVFAIKVKGQTVQMGERKQTKTQNEQEDGHYQMYYLPATQSINKVRE